MTYHTGSFDGCPACGCRDLWGYDDVDFTSGDDGTDQACFTYRCPRCHRRFVATYELVRIDVDEDE